jgi:hypothetical protein
MSGDYHTTATYPTEKQHQRWKSHANHMDMNMSEFIEAMVEAGMKKFDAATVEPDETNRELRAQRNDLKSELDHCRERNRELENQLHHGERGEIRDYVRANPGVAYEEIVQYLLDTVPQRATMYLNDLEGDALRVEDEGYYVRDEPTASDDDRWS